MALSSRLNTTKTQTDSKRERTSPTESGCAGSDKVAKTPRGQSSTAFFISCKNFLNTGVRQRTLKGLMRCHVQLDIVSKAGMFYKGRVIGRVVTLKAIAH